MRDFNFWLQPMPATDLPNGN